MSSACSICEHPKIKARGLCNRCYQRNFQRGTLIDFERKNWRTEELVEEWRLLKGRGFTMRQAAERLGITDFRIARAVTRMRRAGAA